MNNKLFNTLIVITPKDCERLLSLYPRLISHMKYGQVCFVGTDGVGNLVSGDPNIGNSAGFIYEDSIIPFNEVHACMTKKMENLLKGQALPRGVTGWYYQQFLKMQYSRMCTDEYYMVWDGDTIPCKDIVMFQEESGKPYIDLKHEYHKEYFETMGRLLPGFTKVIERSFISEHMLFRTDIMQALLVDIEKNDSIPGTTFWEKIINSIPEDQIQSSAFSEFETYGTYVALKYPTVYKLREWHSFRQGGTFFDVNTICDRDFEWLARDFHSISFEKGHTVREDNKNLFDNPEYQAKLSPKQMLQAAQMEYKEGYKEIWEDDIQNKKDKNVTSGDYSNVATVDNRVAIVIVSYNALYLMQENIKSIRSNLLKGTYKIVVVDNASTDGVAEWLAEQDDILLIRNTENAGFGPACNQGAKAVLGTDFANADIYLLNNDTRLVFDSVYHLKKALYSAEDIGAVGSVSNYAGNKQQIDVEFDTVEEYLKYGEKVNVPMERPCLEKVRLSGFSMLIKRKVWDEVGGFDEDFVPGYFEDDALSMEILRHGYRLMVVRNSFIYHAGSQSFIKTDYQKLLEDNHNLFVEKYGFDILKYAHASGTVVSQIPYDINGQFKVLHYGCGLGAELKAIRSIFPYATVMGIEENPRLYEIAKRTEDVFNSLDEFIEFNEPGTFDVLIISSEDQDRMDDEEKGVVASFFSQRAVEILKNPVYEDFPYEKIKMIVWDMDDTFWQGILSEGEVILPMGNADLITSITDHGVVNSISSKNDEEPVMSELERAGIANLFVFNNINWEDKGPQIATKIKTMGLRAENVLFIDDNPRNLEEARFYANGLMIAGPDIIPYLCNYFFKTVAKDKAHTRLSQYRLLEKKTDAESVSSSKEQFLKDSDIRITINRDCLDNLDRIADLVARSNQLNYTKNRDDKKLLTKLLCSDWNDCGYIRCKDRFGDYGIIGFFVYNTREKKMEHFLFSCRVLGMGIEQYIYNSLGCPEFEVKGPVSVELKKDAVVAWIKEEKELEITEDTSKKNKIRILLKGPCDLDSIEPYLGGGSITSEFNYINEMGFVTTGQNHSMHIWESANLSKEEIDEIVDSVPFIIDGDFKTKLFEEEYHVICYSLLQDMASGLYRNKRTGSYISFSSRNYPLTDKALSGRFISGEIQNHGFAFDQKMIDDFAEEWEFVGTTPLDLLFRNLDYIYDNVKGKPIIILLMGSEVDYLGENEEFAGLSEVYREMNPIIREFVDDHERMRVINITEFISSQEDYADCINHFSRNVYYKIAGEICKYINELV